jgi:hypothetical protein
MTKISITLELDSNNPEDAKLLAAISKDFTSEARYPASGTVALRAAEDDKQIVKAESIQAAVEPKLETKAPVVATPKAVMPTFHPTPKAVMPVAQVAAPVVAAPVVNELPKAMAPAPAPVVAAIASGVTIKDLRDLMSTKVTKHVEILRFKLAELGTANVSSLKPELYEEFYTYLSSLD